MSRKRSRTKRLVTLTAIAVGAFGAAPGAALAAQCDKVPTTKVFAPLGDVNDYFLAPGGDFEGTLSWQRSGPVEQRWTHPPLRAADPTGLVLGAGGSVTSPTLCADELRPTLRFLAYAHQGRGSLRVEAVHNDNKVTPLGRLPGSGYSRGAATTHVPFATALAIESNASKHVALRFTAENGIWATDAVYVDPASRG